MASYLRVLFLFFGLLTWWLVMEEKVLTEPVLISESSQQFIPENFTSKIDLDVEKDQETDRKEHIFSYFVHKEVDSSKNRQETALKALQQLNLVKSKVSEKANLVLIFSLSRVPQYRENNEESYLSLIPSPCLWGTPNERFQCLEAYSNSLGCGNFRDLPYAPRYYRMENDIHCIEALQTDMKNNKNFVVYSIHGDGGDGVYLNNRIFERYRFENEYQCKKNALRSHEVLQERPNREQQQRMNVFIGIISVAPTLAVILQETQEKIEEEIWAQIIKISKFIVNAIIFSLSPLMKRNGKLFQLFSINFILLNQGKLIHFIALKAIPKVEQRVWNEFFIFALAVWKDGWEDNYGGSIFCPSEARKKRDFFQTPTKFEVLVNSRCCSKLEEERFCKPKGIKFFPQPKCPLKDTRLFGSEISCSELGLGNLEFLKTKMKLNELYTSCGVSEMVSMKSRYRYLQNGYRSSYPPRKCSGYLSFDKANSFCKDAGARLCTFQELSILDLAADTGCDGDERRVWSLTQCSINPVAFMTAPGKKPEFEANFPSRCTLASEETSIARCCADLVPPTCLHYLDERIFLRNSSQYHPITSCMKGELLRGSELTCSELRYKFLRGGYTNSLGHRVCGNMITTAKLLDIDTETNRTTETSPSRCPYNLHGTFKQAESKCKALGARLCNSTELGQFFPSFCSWTNFVWSHSSCSTDGNDLIVVSPKYSECRSSKNNNQALIACCADEKGRYCQ